MLSMGIGHTASFEVVHGVADELKKSDKKSQVITQINKTFMYTNKKGEECISIKGSPQTVSIKFCDFLYIVNKEKTDTTQESYGSTFSNWGIEKQNPGEV